MLLKPRLYSTTPVASAIKAIYGGKLPPKLECAFQRQDPEIAASHFAPSLKKALGKIWEQRPHLYAKILIQDTPFTVVKSDLVITHRLKGTNVGDILTLNSVREVGSTDYKLAGTPILPTGTVTVQATVMEHSVGKKKRARMRKQRKGHRPLRTIRPHITVLRIQDIEIKA